MALTGAAPAAPLKKAWPVLGAGVLLAFSSSFGQTFFLALFGGVWRAEFDISHGQLGALYGAATMSSAASLLLLGRIVDDFRPAHVAFVLLLLAAGAALWLSAAGSIITLAIGLFAIRLLGQGLLSHVAMSTVAKRFEEARGRALGITMMGFPTGEALLPIVVASAIALLGWRLAWAGIAGFIAFALLPIIVALLWRADKAHKDQDEGAPSEPDTAMADWRRSEVLRDWRFYCLAPGLLAAPFIITSVLFHQAHLAAVKGWELTAFAGFFPLYAIASTLAGLMYGRLVDAVGCRRLLPFFLMPLAGGLLALSLSNDYVIGAVFMVLIGSTAGAASIVYTALWSELYGTAHLGAIRAVAVSAMIFASALGPAVIGAWLDAGVTMDQQLQMMSAGAVFCVLTLFGLQAYLHRRSPSPSPKR